MKPPYYSPDQEAFIIQHSEKFTAPEIAKTLDLDRQTVYNFGYRNGLTFNLTIRGLEMALKAMEL